MVDNDGAQRSSSSPASTRRSLSPTLIIAAAITVVLVIFIVQNSARVDVNWVVFNSRVRLWVVILVSAVAGYVVGQLVELSLRRRRRQRGRG